MRIVKSQRKWDAIAGVWGWLPGKRKGVAQADQCFLPLEGSLWDQEGTPGAHGGLMSRVRPPYHKGPPPPPTQE